MKTEACRDGFLPALPQPRLDVAGGRRLVPADCGVPAYARDGWRRRRGMVNIWVVLLGLFLIGMMGLALDAAYALRVAQQLQIAADAASLAGAQQVRVGSAEVRQESLRLALANLAGGDPVRLTDNPANAPTGDIVIGRYDRKARVFRPGLSAANSVRVNARRTHDSLGGPVGLFFGPVFGVNTVEITRDAIAMIGGGTGAGLICLDPNAVPGLQTNGNLTIDVQGGAMQVNSTSANSAGTSSGQPTIIASAVNVVGGANSAFQQACVSSGTDYNPGAPPLPDPLLGVVPDLAPADWGPTRTLTGNSGQPGYYPAGISRNGQSLTLSPGIYVLGGSGLDVGGNANITANGVMFYLVNGARLNLGGTGTITITPPDPNAYSYPGVDTYEGVSIFQARDNYASGGIGGTGTLDLQGTIYMPRAFVDIGGTSGSVGNQLIVGSMRLHGQGNRNDITIVYKGAFPAPGNKVFLVE